MGYRSWYASAMLLFLMAVALFTRSIWAGVAANEYNAVSWAASAVSLAVSVAALRQGAAAQRLAETDVTAVASRLAIAVRKGESQARRQLLEGHDQAIDVPFRFRPAAAHDVAAARSGSLHDVVGYYRKLRPKRMVITGAPGSGKTVLAIELILGLLYERAEGDPVPVRMSAGLLGTSAPADEAIEAWMAQYLRQAYQLSKAAARQLVAARMVLPVIDGLDEMDATGEPGYASRAGQAIRACNAYLADTHKAAMVLTCRADPYRALQDAQEWVHDAAQVEVGPVSPAAARSFLARRVIDQGRWQPVLDALRGRGRTMLAEALSTPWRLAVAATVYDARDHATGAFLHDPSELIQPGLATQEQVRDHLLSLLIPVTVESRGGHYQAAMAHRWLGTLAHYLNANATVSLIAGRPLSATDINPRELWPLAGKHAPRAIADGLIAVP
jgi:hypothetical protein